jgi:hypothetical protein
MYSLLEKPRKNVELLYRLQDNLYGLPAPLYGLPYVYMVLYGLLP